MEERTMNGDRKLVPALETQDLALVTVARSLLGGAGIRYSTENQIFQDLICEGRMGVNVAAGPIKLLVRQEDEAEALSLLSDLEVSKTSLRMSRTVRYIVVFLLLVLPVIVYIVIALKGLL